MSRFRCRSFSTITWSSKSRRQLPIQRSATPFCQGLRNAVRTGSVPRFLIAVITSFPNFASRSKREELLGLAIRPCFAHLLHDPEGIGIPSHVASQNFPATVADHEEAVQDSEGKRRCGEEVHRRNRLAVVS